MEEEEGEGEEAIAGMCGKCFIPKCSVWKVNELVGSGEREAKWDVKNQLQLEVMAPAEVLRRVREVEEIVQGQIGHYVVIPAYHTGKKDQNRFKLSLELNRDYRLIEVIFVKTEGGRRVKQDGFQNLGVLSKELFYDHYPAIRMWNKELDEVEFFDILEVWTEWSRSMGGSLFVCVALFACLCGFVCLLVGLFVCLYGVF